jgi:hypothetical protein
MLPAGGLASGGLLTGHSHWDDPNGNYEIEACYEVKANVSGAGSMIAHIPFREQNAPNFYDLQITTSGFKLTKRIHNVSTLIKPTFSTTQQFGVGSGVMFFLDAVGSTFTVYQANGTQANPVKGAMLDQWSDSTYAKGVNISYYTVNHWDGVWDQIVAKPLDSFGVGHTIHGLEQDARAVSGSGNTFDSTLPASASVSGISQAKNGSTATFGLASGPNYTYTFKVDKPGSGHVDFRDPASNPNGSGSYFRNSYYRLSLSSTPTIQRYNGSSAGTTYKAPSGSGSAGTYTLTLAGPEIKLTGPTGQTLLSVNDGGPQSGVRLRLTPGDQTWSWTGAPN